MTTDFSKIAVGQEVFFEDAFDAQKRHAANFRGLLDAEKAVVVWKGQQMTIERARVFAEACAPDDARRLIFRALFRGELAGLYPEGRTRCARHRAELDGDAAEIVALEAYIADDPDFDCHRCYKEETGY